MPSIINPNIGHTIFIPYRVGVCIKGTKSNLGTVFIINYNSVTKLKRAFRISLPLKIVTIKHIISGLRFVNIERDRERCLES